MARYLLLALNGPTEPATEDAYNKWYSEVHVPDLLAAPGVKSARRFKIVQQKPGNWPYAAAYEIETDDLAATLAQMPAPDVPFFKGDDSGHVLAIEIDPQG
jgi:hypothetical protein